MECFCENAKIFELKLEADVDTDPIWCNQCDCNLDINELPISEELRESVMNWAMQYGKWIDWDNDTLCENDLVLEAEHNQLGQTLSKKLQKELGEIYTVRFSPSHLSKIYTN
ncbi:hypothetical protein [Fictibacillus norfolkensis]|uniref:Uncharacterized protein n=1 Tax=Fictibacillus norfolkensis TaxID=2762233 RepID=A0ABR8SMQ4_9BACL|nr:hypothetical protein [Fictibacillus norfolkensis]MBD7964775.1 hypothetical protein [Fictibacillus norfolkensis]